MKVKLLRQVKGTGKAGEIVEVSPARAAFLFSVNLAEPVAVRELVETPEKKTAANHRGGACYSMWEWLEMWSWQ